VDEAAIEATHELRQRIRGRACGALSPLDRGELEESLQAWLEGRGIEQAWELAGTFADEGLTLADLETFAGKVPPAILDDALAFVGSMQTRARTARRATVGSTLAPARPGARVARSVTGRFKSATPA